MKHLYLITLLFFLCYPITTKSQVNNNPQNVHDSGSEKAQTKPAVIYHWEANTFNATDWKEITLNLTSFVNRVGEYEIRFSSLASDYLSNKSSALQFKDYQLNMNVFLKITNGNVPS